MAKKRNCRRHTEEAEIHKEAVRLRKMTDSQLVDYINECRREIPKNAKETAQNDKEKGKAVMNTPDIKVLLESLAEGCVKGVGKSTADKITAYCSEKGLI